MNTKFTKFHLKYLKAYAHAHTKTIILNPTPILKLSRGKKHQQLFRIPAQTSGFKEQAIKWDTDQKGKQESQP